MNRINYLLKFLSKFGLVAFSIYLAVAIYEVIRYPLPSLGIGIPIMRIPIFASPYHPLAIDVLYYSGFYVLLWLTLREKALVTFLFVWSMDEVTNTFLINPMNIPFYASADNLYFFKIGLFVLVAGISFQFLRKQKMKFNLKFIPILALFFSVFFLMQMFGFYNPTNEISPWADYLFHPTYLLIMYGLVSKQEKTLKI